MNTVGKPERLGDSIRCVVSVSMLTEGWDANTVTHVLGIRAFGTQLLCEQGRGPRAQAAVLRFERGRPQRGLVQRRIRGCLGDSLRFHCQTSRGAATGRPGKQSTSRPCGRIGMRWRFVSLAFHGLSRRTAGRPSHCPVHRRLGAGINAGPGRPPP